MSVCQQDKIGLLNECITRVNKALKWLDDLRVEHVGARRNTAYGKMQSVTPRQAIGLAYYLLTSDNTALNLLQLQKDNKLNDNSREQAIYDNLDYYIYFVSSW